MSYSVFDSNNKKDATKGDNTVKIIERPESTTYMLDYAFHLIKDEKEAENVRKLIGDKKIFEIQRIVDKESFQPMLAFAIPEEGKGFYEWMKYVAKLEQLVKP